MIAIAEGLTLDETALAELQAGFRGQIVGRDDPPYDEHRKIWNGSIDRRPALIARCAGVADVMAAVKFARQHGLPVAVRSGGHSFPGLSMADDAFVIDLTQLKGVRVDPAERTARVQAGVLLPRLGRGRARRADDDRRAPQGAAAAIRSGGAARPAGGDGDPVLDR